MVTGLKEEHKQCPRGYTVPPGPLVLQLLGHLGAPSPLPKLSPISRPRQVFLSQVAEGAR